LLTSLEVLNYHGGRKRVNILQQKAEIDPYMGDRMREWIITSDQPIKLPLGIPIKQIPLPDRKSAFEQLAGSCEEEKVDQLITYLSDETSSVQDRLDIVEAINNKILKTLPRGDFLYIHSKNSLEKHLEKETSKKVRKRIKEAILGRPPCISFIELIFQNLKYILGVLMLGILICLVGVYFTYSKSSVVKNIGKFIMFISSLITVLTVLREIIKRFLSLKGYLK
jgi:hypothetical protein